MVGVFIDIEKTYDMVWRHSFLKIYNLGIKEQMFTFIEQLITKRFIKNCKTFHKGWHISEHVPLDNGFYQESVIAPTLFGTFINDPNKNTIYLGWFAERDGLYKERLGLFQKI